MSSYIRINGKLCKHESGFQSPITAYDPKFGTWYLAYFACCLIGGSVILLWGMAS